MTEIDNVKPIYRTMQETHRDEMSKAITNILCTINDVVLRQITPTTGVFLLNDLHSIEHSLIVDIQLTEQNIPILFTTMNNIAIHFRQKAYTIIYNDSFI